MNPEVTHVMPPGYKPLEEPRYIVIRRAPDLPDDFDIGSFDGRWIDRPKPRAPLGAPSMTMFEGVATATGRYERRADGELAEVYEVRP